MREFIDILNKELDYNAYALRSTVQLFHFSEDVDKYEFDSFIRLLMEQSQNIAAMAYFHFHKHSFGEGELESVYWTRFDERQGIHADTVMPLAMANLRQPISRIPGDAVATNIFSIGDDQKYYSFVLQRVGKNDGFVGILVDVSHALKQILDNAIAHNYALYEVDTFVPQKAFRSEGYI